MNFTYPDGATPLELDLEKQLIPDHITTQKELNEWEAANIQEARKWAFFKRKNKNILTISFVKELHKRMFCHTWLWAGEWRKTQTNIGVEPYRIVAELGQLLNDIQYYIDHQTYDLKEIAVRLHHKLVWIHPFPNGNGRHARLMADLLLFDHGEQVINWGENVKLQNVTELRKAYIAALKAADSSDYTSLLNFIEQ